MDKHLLNSYVQGKRSVDDFLQLKCQSVMKWSVLEDWLRILSVNLKYLDPYEQWQKLSMVLHPLNINNS